MKKRRFTGTNKVDCDRLYRHTHTHTHTHIMQTAKQHYDRLLGHHYSWMLGDTAPVIRIFAGMLQHYSVVPNPHGVAIDLGAGNGIHSMLLAQMGYAVTAIDLCAALLQELQDRTLSLPVKTICDDFLQFRQYCSDTADLIVCAGDSLAHLSGWGQVDSLLADVYAALSDGGLLYLSFRDHAAVSAGTTSIVPVKSDREKILTCILQYSDTHIEVTDAT